MSTCVVRAARWQDDSRALRTVREAVFIHEQGVPAALEWDELDATCMHLLAMDSSGKPIGTARLLPDDSIGRMAVLTEWRNKGVGTALMQRLLEEARNRQIRQVILSAQTHATGFYGKFGFQSVGKEFMEAGIPHVRMVLRL
jgi:predicted GNAT family N-acyltransferase